MKRLIKAIVITSVIAIAAQAIMSPVKTVNIDSIEAAVAVTRSTAQAVDLAEQYSTCTENAYTKKCELSTEPTQPIKDKGICRHCGSEATYVSEHGTFCSIDCEYDWLCDNHIYCELCGTTDYTECQCGWLK